jgi:hypothetical protein
MGKISAVLQLCCWIAGSLLLGFALCFPFFSFLPLMWGAGLAAAVVLYFVACAALGRNAIPVGYFVVGLIYTCLFAWSVATFTGVERVERYECAWKVDARGIEIDLSPIGGFGWSRVESIELADHLRKDQPPKVSVDVPVVRDFGRVRARGVIQRVDGIPVREP